MVALTMEQLVEFSRPSEQRIGGGDGFEAEQGGEAARFVAFIGHIHRQGAAMP